MISALRNAIGTAGPEHRWYGARKEDGEYEVLFSSTFVSLLVDVALGLQRFKGTFEHSPGCVVMGVNGEWVKCQCGLKQLSRAESALEDYLARIQAG